MSKVEVDKVIPQSGTTLTIGDSGDTINLVGTLQSNGSPLPGDISSVVAGTGLSGGGTTGAVTLNIEAAQPTITSLGTITGFTSTGIDDNATSTAITIDSSERVGLGRTPTNAPFEIQTLATDLLRFVGNNSQGNYMRSGWYKSDNSTNLAFLNVDGDVQLTFGTTSATPIQIYSNNNERLRITSAGLVGIGETAPLGLLHVKSADSGASANSGHNQVIAENSGNSGMTILSGTSSNGAICFGDSGNNCVGYVNYTHNGNHLDFGVNGNEKLRITSDGDVGIGLTSPAHKLSVFDGSTGIVARFATTGNRSLDISSADNGSYAGAHWNRDVNSAGGIQTFSIEGNEKMRINATEVVVNEASADLDFRVEGNNETHSLFVEGSSGRVKMNTSSSSSPQPTLEVTSFGGTLPSAVLHGGSSTGSGSILIFRNGSGSEVGGVSMSNLNAGSSVSFNTSSDYRLKENIVEITDATTRLKQLKPKRFNFIADANTTVDGFIAHEVSDIVPEAITKEKDAIQIWKEGEELPEGVSVGDNKLDENGNTIPDYQGIDQSKLVPLLVKTIQELEARITTLENA